MVSSKLLQAGIIIASFFTLVTAFQSLAISMIFLVIDLFVSDATGTSPYFLSNFFTYAMLFLLSILVLRKSLSIASWLNDNSQFSGEVKININYSSIFVIILVAHCFFRIVSKIPYMLTSLVEGFGAEISSNDGLLSMFDRENENSINWLQTLLELVMYGVIIYAAKPIAKWFSHQFGSTDENFSFEDDTAIKRTRPLDEDEH